MAEDVLGRLELVSAAVEVDMAERRLAQAVAAVARRGVSERLLVAWSGLSRRRVREILGRSYS